MNPSGDSSPTPYGMHRFNPNASSQAWEESLGQMSQLTDQNIIKLQSMQRSRQPVPSEPIPRYQLTQTPSLRTSSSIPISSSGTGLATGSRVSMGNNNASHTRAQSAPRHPKSTVDTMEHNSYNPHLVATNDGMERKIDYLMKRTKQLEDKIKKNERETVVNNETATMSCSAMEKLMEQQKNDKKMILGLREAMTDLKNQMELLVQRDDVRERAMQRTSSTPLQSVDVETIKEVVFHRVEADFQKVIQEVVRACASEQASYLSSWAEREKAEREKAIRGGVDTSNAVSVLERDVTKINQDMLRLKSRQDSVDAALIELRDAVSVREIEAAEAHRKSISSYRTEMQTVVDAVGRKINEQLSSLSTVSLEHNRKFEDKLLRQDHDVARVSANLLLLEESVSNITSRVQSMQSTVTKCEDKVTQALTIASSADNTSRRSAEQAEHVTKMFMHPDRSLATSQSTTTGNANSIGIMESRLQSALDSIQSLQLSIDRLSSASVAATGSLEDRVENITSLIQAEQNTRGREIGQLGDTIKRLRTKIRDNNVHLTSVSQMRERIDAVLNELEDKRRVDESKFLQHSSTLEKFSLHLQQLDSTTVRLRDDFKAKINQIQSSISNSFESNAGGASLQELRAQIGDHSKQISVLTEVVNELQEDISDMAASEKQRGQTSIIESNSSYQRQHDESDESVASKSSTEDNIYSFPSATRHQRSSPSSNLHQSSPSEINRQIRSQPKGFGRSQRDEDDDKLRVSSQRKAKDSFVMPGAPEDIGAPARLEELAYSPISQSHATADANRPKVSSGSKYGLDVSTAAHGGVVSGSGGYRASGRREWTQFSEPDEPSSPVEFTHDGDYPMIYSRNKSYDD